MLFNKDEHGKIKKLHDRLKDSKVKDGGSFGTTFVEIDDVNQIDLSLIVKTIKDRLKQFGDILMEVTRGRLQKTDARQGLASIEFQLDVLDDNRSRRRYWSDITLAFRGTSKFMFKIYESGNKYEIEKFVQDVQKKLKQYEGKTIYKNNTIPDSKSKDSKVKDDPDLYSEFGTIVDDLMNAANDAYKARKKYGEASKQFAFLKAKIQVEKDSEILKKYMDFQKEKKRYDNMAGFM